MAVTQAPVVIGRITSVYGVKGWLKLHSYTEPMDNILAYDECLLQRHGEWQAVAFEAAKPHGKGLVVKLAGVDDREVARDYCQCDIAVPADAMPALDDGEFYWHELVGLRVMTAADKADVLGVVDHLLETGANDVLVVRPCSGSIDQRERLIPWLPEQVVREVDLDAGEMRVDWDPEI